MRVLIRFDHGLGDAVQLTVVLRHLEKYLPSAIVDVWALHGKHSCYRGLCSRVFSDQGEQPRECDYDQILRLSWFECHQSFEAVPSTKASLCLRDVFRLEPEPGLCRYSIKPRGEDEQRAERYLQQLTGRDPVDMRWPVMLLHYQGNTSAEKKNLRHDVAAELCRFAMQAGLVPVVLDWDRRSPLPDGRDIFCPGSGHELWGNFGSGDAGTMAALIERAALFVGVDSGPLHVAGATTTPAIGVWTGHHPIRYFDLADNVTHLVPAEWRNNVTAQQARVFEQHYRFREQTGNLAADACRLAADMLGRKIEVDSAGQFVRCRGFWVRRDNVAQDLVIVDDVYYADCYKLGIIAETVKNARVVVDIGSHIGVFARLVHDRNPDARIICVEACPENLDALRANVGGFAEIVHAACTYDSGELGLLNAVRPNCTSTGGSIVAPIDKVGELAEGEYWPDRRPVPKVTLEQLGERYGFAQIDLLKLDCEGSELSIFGNCDLSRVRFAVGEYHDYGKWESLRATRLAKWDYGHMSQAGELGNFHLRNTE